MEGWLEGGEERRVGLEGSRLETILSKIKLPTNVLAIFCHFKGNIIKSH